MKLTTIALASLLTASAGHAQTLYSVDYTTDELVSIDAATGQVTVIGAIGFDAVDAPHFDVHLASLGGTLYGVAQADATAGHELFSLDIGTGAATILATTNVSGTGFDPVGLTSFGGSLYTGNNTDFGPLALDGTVTYTTGVFGAGAAHGFAYDAGGQLYASSDTNPGSQLYTISPTAYLGHASIRYRALTFVDGGDLFGLGWNEITQVNPLDGSSITVTALDRSSSYSGLAAIPAPGSLTLLGVGGLLATIRRR